MQRREHVPTRGMPIASPNNMLPVQVVKRTEIAPDTVSVHIVLPGSDQAPAPYMAGQFVTLALPTPRETLYRSYSLCGDGDPAKPWELTIKRVQNGAVSNFFYEQVREGALLYSSLPRGVFTLPTRVRPDMVFSFVAVGSGITPLMGMIRSVARMAPNDRPRVLLHYASRTPADIIFRDELSRIDPNQHWLYQRHYLSARGDRMSPDAIMEQTGSLARKASWYICGPATLGNEVKEQLATLGVPESQVHAEVFATAPGPKPAYRLDTSPPGKLGGAAPTIQVADTGQTVDVQPQETLLAALERNGYHPEFSCRAGACGSCKLQVLQGQVSPIGEALSPNEKSLGYVLSCIARPVGDVTIASGGRPPRGVAAVAGAVAAGVGRSAQAVMALRVTTLLSVGALLLGAWRLTDHRPESWSQQTTTTTTTTTTQGTPAPGTTVAPGAAPTATPKPQSSGSSGGGSPAPAPTATPKPVSSGGGGSPAPAPTATPKPPAPAPTATSTPSPSKP